MKAFFLLLLAVFSVNALDVQVTLPKAVFSTGDVVTFNYSISSNATGLVSFYPTVDCDTLPKVMYELKKVELSPGKSVSGSYSGLRVDNFEPTKNCSAVVQVVSPSRQKFSKPFEIATLQSIPFSLKACADAACTQEKKVFTAAEGIFVFFAFNSAVVSFEVQTPSKTFNSTSNPLEITEREAGAYRVKASVSSEGRRPGVQELSFAVIESQPVFQTPAPQPFTPSPAKSDGLLNFLLLANEVLLLLLVFLYLLSGGRKESVTGGLFYSLDGACCALFNAAGLKNAFVKPLQERGLPVLLVTLAITSSVLLFWVFWTQAY